ncbi:MAG: hypothetical protein WB623_06965, partial [Candidatus Sulfotelmatobacter sp.]
KSQKRTARGRHPSSESGDSGGNDWYNPLTSEFLHEQIQKLGFIHCNGGLQVHSSLSIALHE